MITAVLALVRPEPQHVVALLLSPLSVLAGLTALTTGLHAGLAVLTRANAAELAHAVNIGIARGFLAGAAPTVGAFVAALHALQSAT